MASIGQIPPDNALSARRPVQVGLPITSLKPPMSAFASATIPWVFPQRCSEAECAEDSYLSGAAIFDAYCTKTVRCGNQFYFCSLSALRTLRVFA